MSEHPNASLVRAMLDAINHGNMAELDNYLADDVVWHEIGTSEPKRGKEAMRAGAPGAGADYDIAVKVHDVVANDGHTVALVEATATRGSRTLVYRTAEIMHIRDGKIVERWAFADDTAAITAFFA
jgi:uncharacterized protein